MGEDAIEQELTPIPCPQLAGDEPDIAWASYEDAYNKGVQDAANLIKVESIKNKILELKI